MRGTNERIAGLVSAGVITKERACDSKRLFFERNHAKASCKKMALVYGRKFAPYRCPFGDHWHIKSLDVDGGS